MAALAARFWSLAFALATVGALAQTPFGTIRGRVDVRRPPPHVERRPGVSDLGMAAPHDNPDRLRSVVYLESAPALAFPDVEPVELGAAV